MIWCCSGFDITGERGPARSVPQGARYGFSAFEGRTAVVHTEQLFSPRLDWWSPLPTRGLGASPAYSPHPPERGALTFYQSPHS